MQLVYSTHPQMTRPEFDVYSLIKFDPTYLLNPFTKSMMWHKVNS